MPQHILAEVANKIPPRFGEPSSNDVFLMVKAFVSDHELCQEPLAVWPGNGASDCLHVLQKIARNEVSGILAKPIANLCLRRGHFPR